MTGSRVGGRGPLMIGSANAGGKTSAMVSPLSDGKSPPLTGPKGSGSNPDDQGKSAVNAFAFSAFSALGVGSEDGSKAYRQLRIG